MPLSRKFLLAISLGCLASVLSAPGRAQTPEPAHNHFDAKGAQPSRFTLDLRQGGSATLPFEDKRDFEEAKKGFIAAPPYDKIMADAGHVAWDMGSYQFLLQGKDFTSSIPPCCVRPC